MNSASSLRRVAVIAAPTLAALLIVIGFFVDPAIEKSGRELAAEYAAHQTASRYLRSPSTSGSCCSRYRLSR